MRTKGNRAQSFTSRKEEKRKQKAEKPDIKGKEEGEKRRIKLIK